VSVVYWLKHNDHVHEQVWQKLLSYLYVLYYSLDQTLLKNIPAPQSVDPMYVPTLAIRHNDHTINSMLLRRFTILRPLTKTSAMVVYDKKRIRVVPFESIINRLFCPSTIKESIGTNIMRYLRGVYIVHDVHALATNLYPAFRRDSSSVPFYQSSQQYLDVILFLEELLHHYSSHNVHPKFLVQDLLTGQCLTDLEQQSWIDHLHDLKEIPADSGDFRRHLRSHRLQRIDSCSSTSYFTMSDKELQHSIKTIQQLLVEYGVLFSGGGMTSDDEELAYTQVGYESLLENHLNIGGFAGLIWSLFTNIC